MNVGEQARQYLRDALGPEAEFRDGQLEAILTLAEGRGRALVVQRTGWGKSVVYFIATRLLRDQGLGPTVLISPLLALMRDQVRLGEALGVHATSLNSHNESQWSEIEQDLESDAVDVLLISPERLRNERFRSRTIPAIRGGIGLFVVDEAHCISDWGHDFRPDYRRIRRLTQALPPGVPLLATTATANDRVVDDIAEQLGPDLEVIRGPLGRESLHLQTIGLDDQAERLAWILDYLRCTEGSGIIYALTAKDTRRVSDWLGANGTDAPAYYGPLDKVERRRLEIALRDNEVKALVATIALGMGFDKPDLAFVIHFQRPASVISYYQQIGRAGRGLERAEVILLSGGEDDAIAEYFIEGAFPAESVLSGVLGLTEEIDDGASRKDIEERLNVPTKSIKQALSTLEVEGAVFKDGTKWDRTANPWKPDAERVEAVTAMRRVEHDQMRAYAETDGCLMRFLTEELDDDCKEDCGRCANCTEPFVSAEIDPKLAQEASKYLKRAHRPIEPRQKWASGLPAPQHGNIPPAHRLREGRALCIYGDSGWGQLVKRGKFSDGRFDDELVEAVAEMIAEDMEFEAFPTWVAAVPSRRNLTLVPDFAERLADRLGLAYRSALVKQSDTGQQKDMENSFQQARNAIGAFSAVPDQIITGGPVFLVDDMVDSRWSLTVCGVALAEAGSGPIYPIALGQTSTSAAP